MESRSNSQALLKWGGASGTASKELSYLVSKKDATGAWGTTQATIMALRALLLSTEKGAADVRGTVEVALNGRTVERLTLTPENNDLLHQFVIKGVDQQSANNVSLKFEGKGGLACLFLRLQGFEKPAKDPCELSCNGFH